MLNVSAADDINKNGFQMLVCEKPMLAFQYHFFQILLKKTLVDRTLRLGNIFVRYGKKEYVGAGHIQRLTYFIKCAFCWE